MLLDDAARRKRLRGEIGDPRTLQAAGKMLDLILSLGCRLLGPRDRHHVLSSRENRRVTYLSAPLTKPKIKGEAEISWSHKRKRPFKRKHAVSVPLEDDMSQPEPRGTKHTAPVNRNPE